MILNKPFTDPNRYLIPVLDFVTSYKLPFHPYIPLLYTQAIKVTPELYPPKPPDRSQIYRQMHPPEENPWLGGVPIGRIISQNDKKSSKLVIKQFRHKISSEIYNPPLHLTFDWADYGGEANTLQKILEIQKEFNDKHNAWRNRYRVRYCELSDMFFLQVKVNHFIPNAVFECDIEDIEKIFAHSWYLYCVKYIDEYNEELNRYHIVQKDSEDQWRKSMNIIKFLVPEGQRTPRDFNVLNCRKNNLLPPQKRRY